MSDPPQQPPQYPGQQPPSYPPQQPPGPPQMPPQGGQPPEKPKKPRRWLTPAIATGAGLLGLIIGVAASGGGSEDAAGTQAATGTKPAATVTAEVTVTAKAKPQSTVTVTQKAKPKPRATTTVTVTQKAEAPEDEGGGGGNGGEIGDGTYLVGSDIQPGTYKSDGSGSSLCYADTQSEDGDIMEQEVAQSGETVVMRVKSNAYTFTSRDCGNWTKVG
ncbi:MAG TPA: hypothetical protein VIP98_06035 [Microlunatus sp.]